jgi:hypothetical protein
MSNVPGSGVVLHDCPQSWNAMSVLSWLRLPFGSGVVAARY